jgi:hypothetical protein
MLDGVLVKEPALPQTPSLIAWLMLIMPFVNNATLDSIYQMILHNAWYQILNIAKISTKPLTTVLPV